MKNIYLSCFYFDERNFLLSDIFEIIVLIIFIRIIIYLSITSSLLILIFTDNIIVLQ